KRDRIPLPFRRDLRQQQASAPILFDEQAMRADLDVVRAANRLERAEERQLDVDVIELGGRDRLESRILAARGDGALRDDLIEPQIGREVADAPAQISVAMHADED